MVRTGVNTTDFVPRIGCIDTDAATQVASRCLVFNYSRFRARLVGSSPVVKLDHVDISVGAVLGAQATANAVVFDLDFEGTFSMDGVDGTANHAIGVSARSASAGDQVFVKPQSFTDQAGDASMRVGTSSHTFIATSAAIQIENQRVSGR